MKIAIVGFDFPDCALEEGLCRKEGIAIQRFDGKSPEYILEHVHDVDGVISSYGEFTDEVIKALSPRLKVISRTGTGYDEIDVSSATKHGVAVCNVPGYGTEVVSDHAIALALACLRRINEQDAAMRKGQWGYESTRPLGQRKGRVFGVIGMGSIGSAVARKAAGLGFEVVCWSRSLPAGSRSRGGYRVVELDELARTCDVISLHTALTEETRHLVDEWLISLMRPETVIVNTSRGAVIDTVALARALEEGRLWGAGVDVFETEPIERDDPLLKAPRTVLTPHAAYWSEESGVELRTRACRAAIDVLKGNVPRDCLNPKTLETNSA